MCGPLKMQFLIGFVKVWL